MLRSNTYTYDVHLRTHESRDAFTGAEPCEEQCLSTVYYQHVYNTERERERERARGRDRRRERETQNHRETKREINRVIEG